MQNQNEKWHCKCKWLCYLHLHDKQNTCFTFLLFAIWYGTYKSVCLFCNLHAVVLLPAVTSQCRPVDKVTMLLISDSVVRTWRSCHCICPSVTQYRLLNRFTNFFICTTARILMHIDQLWNLLYTNVLKTGMFCWRSVRKHFSKLQFTIYAFKRDIKNALGSILYCSLFCVLWAGS